MAETIQETVYKKPSLVTKEEIIKELQRVYFEHFENSYMSYAKFRQYSALSQESRCLYIK